MSIVFLKESVTNKNNEFEDSRRSYNSKIFICYDDDKNNNEKKSVPVDDFSVDITLGGSWNENYSYNDNSLCLLESDYIKIQPKATVVVTVSEFIRVPNNRFGIVVSTGSIFLQYGVQSPTAKVEPGYSGTLILRLTNQSTSIVEIKKGDKLASIIFFETNHTIEHVNAENSRLISEKKATKREKVSLFWNEHKSKLITFILVLTAIVSATFTALMYFNPQANVDVQKTEINNKIEDKK